MARGEIISELIPLNIHFGYSARHGRLYSINYFHQQKVVNHVYIEKRIKIHMKRGMILFFVFIILSVQFALSSIVINEFVVDPQRDWDRSTTIGSNDEWVELYNNGLIDVDITGWNLNLIDASNATQILSGIIFVGQYFLILNPLGSQQINGGQLILYNNTGGMVDSVTYGNYDDGNISDNAPNGNANDVNDECLTRIPNGVDTDVDSDDFVRMWCTFNSTNINFTSEVNFSINSNLYFGSIMPGSNSDVVNSTIIIGENNNVNLTFEIELNETSDNVLENLFFDFDGDGLFEDSEKLNKTLNYNSIDNEGEYLVNIGTRLSIPAGYRPGDFGGVIIYTATISI